MTPAYYQQLKAKFSGLTDSQISDLIQYEFGQQLNATREEIARWARETMQRKERENKNDITHGSKTNQDYGMQ